MFFETTYKQKHTVKKKKQGYFLKNDRNIWKCRIRFFFSLFFSFENSVVLEKPP